METALSNHDLNSYEDGVGPENGTNSGDVSISTPASEGKEQDSSVKVKSSSDHKKSDSSSHHKSNHSHKERSSSSDRHHKHHDGDHKSKENHVSSNSHHKDSSSSKHREDKSKSSSSSHHHSSSSSKHKSKHSSKDGHSSGSSKDSSSKTKEGHSSDGSKSKEKSHSSSSGSKSDHDKHRDKSKDGHSSSKSNGEKKHSSSSSGEKKSHSSSSSKHSSSNSDKKSHSSSDKSSSGEKKPHSDRRDGEKKHSSSSDKKDKHSEKRHDIPEVKRDSSPSKHKSSDEKRSSEKSKHDGHNDRHKEKKEHKPDKDKIKKEPSSPEKPVVKSQEEYHSSPVKVKNEANDSDSDVPLAARKKVEVNNKSVKREADSESEDEPLAARAQKKKVKTQPTKKRKYEEESDDDYDSDVPLSKKKKQIKAKAAAKQRKPVKQETSSPRKKKVEEPEEVWKWWEEEKYEDGRKWTTLEHKGPVFAPEYEPLPENVRFYYDGKKVRLSQDAEEIATFYARMLDHDYTTKDSFNRNFFKDWRKSMTSQERELITDLKKCNFKEIDAYFKMKSEERKALSKEEKKAIKLKNEEIGKEYGICIIDKHKEKIGNFRIEPPGLFRGRGEHPKMGMLKRRLMPEDIIINCSKGFEVPPPHGHKWKEVRHDNKVTWLASWTENVQGQVKYIMLNPASRLKGEKDWQKYETARKLKKCVASIRGQYMEDWKSKEMKCRQRAVALYFIDKLALRAGNEKDEDQADTVGCCSLRVEHIKLHKEKDDKENVVEFDFLGKDSIRYYNAVSVEKRVFKNLQLFMENKKEGDDLFDRLNTSILNQYLNTLMEGLTAKVFRTYNASTTLQDQLEKLTDPDDPVPAKILSYNRANRAVAILCNHQRAAPKTFEKSMENMQKKIEDKENQVEELEKEVKRARKDKNRKLLEVREKQLAKAKEQLHKQRLAATDKEENKEIALGTSKLNYLDPRISVAWCKKFDVPIEKIYNRTQRDKFRWAIDMTEEDFEF